MPVANSSNDERKRLTLNELVAIRRAIPPIPTDTRTVTLAERFLVPPFSVLDARQGYWQDRKRTWLDLGMQYGQRATSGGNHAFSDSVEMRESKQGGNFFGHGGAGSGERGDINRYKPRKAGRQGNFHHARNDQTVQQYPKSSGTTGKCYNMGMDGGDADTEENVKYSTPVFDPVLCELAYRWFCPAKGHVVDPFAGTALSGIVAGRLGRRYTGIDINPQQVEQNRLERDAICPKAAVEWIHGDSMEARKILGMYGSDTKCDLLFSCPPYGDLVQYSDDPRDISTMEYNRFLSAYQAIIRETCQCLNKDRFAVWVIGEFRNPRTGSYRGFVGDTVAAFRAAGLELYNDMILVTAVGSLPLRVGKQFTGSRKVGKTHQNILVFVKGDAALATAACGEVDVADLDMPECAPGRVAVYTKDCAELECRWYIDGGTIEDRDDMMVLDMPMVEACLLCDIMRGEARAVGVDMPRVWLGTASGWQSVPGMVELTYVVGDSAYLSRTVFPTAAGPTTTIPTPSRLE